MSDNPWQSRHPSVRHFERLLTPNPNLPEHLWNISKDFEDLALKLLDKVGDGQELSAALRLLWEAKNCAVMQNVIDGQDGR